MVLNIENTGKRLSMIKLNFHPFFLMYGKNFKQTDCLYLLR